MLRPDASMLRTLIRGRSRARAEPLKSWLACSEVAETSTPLASDGRRPDLLLSVRQPEVATLAILGATSSAMFYMPSAEVRQGAQRGGRAADPDRGDADDDGRDSDKRPCLDLAAQGGELRRRRIAPDAALLTEGR